MTTTLQRSFSAVYRLLEQPRAARRAVAGLLVIHTLLLGYSAYVHSPTLNEPGHLVAGISYWNFGRFDVYNVNPPLVKMVAAFPVMAVGYNEDWSGFYEDPGARPEMAMGENFVAANGERSFFLFMIARWACIPFSWLGIIVCFLWARDLYGRPAGVLAATIWCFEPNILAHAALITSDAGATALGLAACYTFWRWLKRPNWTQAVLTGVVLGLAELTKTTLILFYPLWPIMWLIYRWSDRGSMLPRDWLIQAGMLAMRMIIGLYVLNLGYGFEGSFTQLKDFTFVSDLFTGKKPEPLPTDTRHPTPDTSPPNRFTNTFLANLPVPFPKNYLLGIDLQQKDFEHYGRPSYLRGVWQDHGWWYYYLYACAIKVPLGLWALGFLALFLSLWERQGEGALFPRPTGERLGEWNWLIANSRQPTATTRDLFILLFPPLVIFIIVSSKTGFSEHMRYVLPTFPFFFIAVSGLAQLLVLTIPARTVHARTALSIAQKAFGEQLTMPPPIQYTPNQSAGRIDFRNFRRLLLVKSLIVTCASWLIASSLWIYPHSLSYFNESIGGPLKGPTYLLGSNVDWGQDLIYAVDYAAVNKNLQPRYVAFYYLKFACSVIENAEPLPAGSPGRKGGAQSRIGGLVFIGINHYCEYFRDKDKSAFAYVLGQPKRHRFCYSMYVLNASD